MSRRIRASHLESGSDSFLDIIANIVGILIILIVIAGVRASQLPAVQPTASQEEPEELQFASLDVSLGPVAPEEEDIPPIPERPPLAAPEPPAPVEPSPQLLAEQGFLTAKIPAVAEEIAQSAKMLLALESLQKKADQQLASVRETLGIETKALEKNQARLTDGEDEIANLRAEASRLADEAESISVKKPEVKKLYHRLTPVSKIVEGQELHFRLSENRIARIPLKPLLDQLRTEVRGQKDWLAKFRSHRGSVGPMNGFSLKYLVERQATSIVDEINNGPGFFRVIVSAWAIRVEEDMYAETADDALQNGSRFFSALQTAKPKSTLTFWVYPDSYGLFRHLQKVAHANDFTVAARPLPHGVPIAGSPHGSRSTGQ